MPPKLYKAADVCETIGVQPYVLRSWEKEFPGIGVQKSPETPRLYRQFDIEQVLRIKQLVFGEGLTLAGARRRLEEAAPKAAGVSESEIDEVLDTLGADARARIALVRDGLRLILDVLSKTPGAASLADLRQNGSSHDRQGSSRDRRGGPSRLRNAPARLAEAQSAKAARPPQSSGRQSAKRTVSAKRGAAPRKASRSRAGKRKRVTA